MVLEKLPHAEGMGQTTVGAGCHQRHCVGVPEGLQFEAVYVGPAIRIGWYPHQGFQCVSSSLRTMERDWFLSQPSQSDAGVGVPQKVFHSSFGIFIRNEFQLPKDAAETGDGRGW